MTLTKDERVTLKSYDLSASSWANKHSDLDFWEAEFKIFNNLILEGKILEIGCGGGRDAHVLSTLGYNYLGTDVSREFIKVAQKNNPKLKFEFKSVYDLDYPRNSFDGFWASAVLLHIPKTRMNEALQSIHRVTRKNGVGFIAIKEGGGQKILEEESSDGKKYKRLWSFYKKEEFKKILEDNGFKVVKFTYKPMSERTRWLIYFVKVVK